MATQKQVDVKLRTSKTGDPKAFLSTAKDVEELAKRIKKLERESKQIQGAIRGAQKEIRGLGDAAKHVKTLERGVTDLRRAFLALGGVMILRKGIQEIADFSEQMSKLQAVSQASTEDMTRFTEAAKALGVSTEFSASQAGEAMENLARAGLSAGEILSSIGPSLDLATAASLDLGSAADVTVKTLKQFGLEASEAARVTDVLAAASAASNTDVTQMGEALKQVGPVASALGISIEDTAAAIGVLGDAGIQGSDAGSALKAILAGLVNPSREAEAAIKDLNLTVEELNPATNSMEEIFGKLQAAGLSAADAFEIFGKRGAPGILAVTSQVGHLRELGEEMDAAGGHAKEMAAIVRDNLAGDIKALNSAIEGAVLGIGEGLSPALRDATQGLTDMTRKGSDLKEFGETLGTVGNAFASFAGAVSDKIRLIAGLFAKFQANLTEFVLRWVELPAKLLSMIPGLEKVGTAIKEKIEDWRATLRYFSDNLDDDLWPDGAASGAKSRAESELGELTETVAKPLEALHNRVKETGERTAEVAMDGASQVARALGQIGDAAEEEGDRVGEAGKETAKEVEALVKTLIGETAKAAPSVAVQAEAIRIAFGRMVDETQKEKIRAMLQSVIDKSRQAGAEIPESLLPIADAVGVVTTALERPGFDLTPFADDARQATDEASAGLEKTGTAADAAADGLERVADSLSLSGEAQAGIEAVSGLGDALNRLGAADWSSGVTQGLQQIRADAEGARAAVEALLAAGSGSSPAPTGEPSTPAGAP